ncbi:MAG TPA: hypothetical protein VMT54_00285 [Candidatus Cybelea sp.]|nr:hypothetical protein [Candidatus Cybelea sp.]
MTQQQPKTPKTAEVSPAKPKKNDSIPDAALEQVTGGGLAVPETTTVRDHRTPPPPDLLHT